MTVTISIKNLIPVQLKLAVGVKPALRAASLAIAEEVRTEMARYPGPVAYPIRWASAKQRRVYFAKRRGIGLPYVRQSDPMSQRLGPSWFSARHGDVGAKAATRVSYAPYVQNYLKQQPMHKATGWRTDKQAAEIVIRSGVVRKHIVAALRKQFG